MTISAENLQLYIERIECLEEEKATSVSNIRDVYAEAKGNGFDAKIMRAIVKLRKLTTSEAAEQETMIDIYKAALGMVTSEVNS